MGKGILEKVIQKEGAKDLCQYWLSTHGRLSSKKKSDLPWWALDIIFSQTDRETGRIDNQPFDFFFHGTVNDFKDSLEQKGLKYSEGIACFTRRITYALENFSLMGNYTMIGNGSIDEKIAKLVEEGVIDKDLPEEGKAKLALEYWSKDEIREKFGLLTIWRPPEEMIALARKEQKIFKRHFALYNPKVGQKAKERRKELAKKKGEKSFLDPKFLLAELKPTFELRFTVAELTDKYTHGQDIFRDRTELPGVVKKSLLKINPSYSQDQLSRDILISICEGYTLSLVAAIVTSLVEGKVSQKRIAKLENLIIPLGYVERYRDESLGKLKKRLKDF